MEPQLHTARLAHHRELSERTSHLEFRVSDASRFDFHAGQFISMKAMHDGREVTRAYSIASGPRGDNSFELCLNRVGAGFFSNFLCDLPPGSDVTFHGPHGFFLLKQPVRSSIFLANGTGIAPIRSMIQFIFTTEERNVGREFWLLFGSRMEADIHYRKEFERLASEHANFHFIPTLSRGSESWPGRRGYVQQHLRELASGRADWDAYICGLKDMVSANRELLTKELGWDRRSVVYERFD